MHIIGGDEPTGLFMMSTTTMVILGTAFMVIAYFLGCISPATVLAKAKGIDIRKEGSGNPGTTNVLRTMGKKAAMITLAIDVLKGVLAVLLGSIVAPIFAYGCGAMVMCGHIWPFQFKFKGGKGVATALGVIVTVDPLLALLVLAVFVALTATTRYVSLGSCAAAVSLPFLSLLLERGFFGFAGIMAIIVVFKHRENIIRILNGEESKLSFKK